MPDLRLGTTVPTAIKLGSTNVSKVYQGDTLVWPIGACTQVLSEPFNNLSAWTLNGTPTIVAGRTGTAASFTGSSNTADYNIPSGQQSDTVTLGFAFQVASLATNRLIASLRSDATATQHSTITITTTGAVSISGASSVNSAAGVVTAGAWHYIELQAKLHDTAGYVVVRVNGMEVANQSSIDTKAGGTKTVYDSVRLGPGGSSHTLLVDDLYITTGAGCPFKGDQNLGTDTVLLEPFDNTTAWTTANGTPTIVAGRTGNAVSLNASAVIDYVVPVPSRSDYITVGFAWRINSAAAGMRYVLRLYSDSSQTEHLRLMHDSTGCLILYCGAGTPEIGRSAVSSIAINTYYYVEIQARTHDSLGSAIVRLNGATVISGTGFDTNLNTPVFGAIRCANSTSGVTSLYDDLYVTMGPAGQFKGSIAL